eukprot:1142138-Pelagomonas_calceolata.AAC.3
MSQYDEFGLWLYLWCGSAALLAGTVEQAEQPKYLAEAASRRVHVQSRDASSYPAHTPDEGFIWGLCTATPLHRQLSRTSSLTT